MGEENCFSFIYGLKNNQIIWVEANPKLVEQNLRVDTSRIIKNFICASLKFMCIHSLKISCHYFIKSNYVHVNAINRVTIEAISQ